MSVAYERERERSKAHGGRPPGGRDSNKVGGHVGYGEPLVPSAGLALVPVAFLPERGGGVGSEETPRPGRALLWPSRKLPNFFPS